MLNVCSGIKFIGGKCGRVIPGNMPNPEVKPASVDGTVRGTHGRANRCQFKLKDEEEVQFWASSFFVFMFHDIILAILKITGAHTIMSTFKIKQTLPILLLFASLFASIAEAKSAKIGALAAIGQDEKAVLAWTENIADAEGKALPFRNTNSIVFFDDLNSMIMALRAGQIDRFAIGLNTAKYITLRNKDFKLIDNKHNAVLGMSIAVREEDKNKLLGINLAINDMWTDGTLERFIRENIIELGDNDPEAAELPKFDDALTMKIAVTGDLPPMDCILPDGRPAGFNTVFLAELGRRTHTNFELVSISSGARQTAISSGRVDALFWTRGVYNNKRQPLPYPLDKVAGVAVSEPYFIENRAAVSLKDN